MTGPDPFRYDDAAYVLGALSPAEHAAFAEHLIGCTECSARVAEIADMPGMLSGIAAHELSTSDPVLPDTLLPGLLRRARTERRRFRLVASGLAATAAAAIVALSFAVFGPSSHSTTDARAMAALRPSAVTATAAVTSHAWGTAIALTCHYTGGYGADTYDLVVVDKSGALHAAGSWTLGPGQVTRFTGGTAVPRDQIAQVEITLPDDQPILSLTL
jgi:hypothetical protein